SIVFVAFTDGPGSWVNKGYRAIKRVMDIKPSRRGTRTLRIQDFINVVAVNKQLITASAVIFAQNLPVVVIIVPRSFIGVN
ncbi:MAG: hypothetical protein ACYSUY_15975, partial [Planctomycetota bacterium]